MFLEKYNFNKNIEICSDNSCNIDSDEEYSDNSNDSDEEHSNEKNSNRENWMYKFIFRRNKKNKLGLKKVLVAPTSTTMNAIL